MKAFIGMLFLLSLISAHAEIIKVKGMSKDGELERSFVLKTNFQEKIVLDCQSFIQGLRIGEFEEAYTYLLDPQDCESLYKRIRSSLKKRRSHCIDIEADIRSDRACF